MSDYYLADRVDAERAKQREGERELRQQAPKAQEIKATLLGDFLFPSTEPQGADPYNSTQGKAVHEAWRTRPERR